MSETPPLHRRSRSLRAVAGDVLRRARPFLLDLVRKGRTQGFRAAASYLLSRVTELTENLVYEYRTVGGNPSLPEGWTVQTFHGEGDPDIDRLVRAGGGEEMHHFRRQAVAYVLSIDGEPVAHGWRYPWDPVARWLGPDAVYLGSAWVRPEWRGRGINGAFFAYVTGHMPAGTRVVMLVAVENRASQASLAKSPARCLGLLRVRMVLAMVWKIRLLPVPPGGLAGPRASRAREPGERGPGV